MGRHPYRMDVNPLYFYMSFLAVTTPVYFEIKYTAERQWLKHLENQDNMFETAIVRADEC